MTAVDTTREDVSAPSLHTPSAGSLLSYATGSVGMGVWVTVPGLLLLFFLTDVLAVTPWIAGLALLLPKAIDVVVHPWFGTVSDRQRRKYGHRRHMMWIGLFLTVAMVAMFSVPASLSGAGAALWVGTFYVLGNLLFASFQVPYLTTPSDLNISYHQRTRVMTYRMVVLTVGLLGAGVMAPALVKSGQRGDYTTMALMLSVVMLVSGIVAILGIRKLQALMPQSTEEHWHPGFREGVSVALKDRDFRMLVLSYLFTGTVTHLFMAGVPYYAEYVFGSVGLTALFMGAFLAPALLATPVWLRVSRRTGKKKGLLISPSSSWARCPWPPVRCWVWRSRRWSWRCSVSPSPGCSCSPSQWSPTSCGPPAPTAARRLPTPVCGRPPRPREPRSARTSTARCWPSAGSPPPRRVSRCSRATAP